MYLLSDSKSTRNTRTHTTVLWPSCILSGTTRVSWHQKGKTRKIKPIWIYWNKIMSGSGISSAICKSAHWSRHTLPLSFYRPVALPAAQPTASNHWRQFQRYQKGKRFWILMKQKMMWWQWHQLDCMQIICILLQTVNHASTTLLRFFYLPDALPSTQSTLSKLFTVCDTQWILCSGNWMGDIGARMLSKALHITRNSKLSTGTIMAHQLTVFMTSQLLSRSKCSCHSLDLVPVE